MEREIHPIGHHLFGTKGIWIQLTTINITVAEFYGHHVCKLARSRHHMTHKAPTGSRHSGKTSEQIDELTD